MLMVIKIIHWSQSKKKYLGDKRFAEITNLDKKVNADDLM